MKVEYRWVILVTILAFVLRSLVLPIAYQHPERILSNDSPSYIQPAEWLVADGSYTYPELLRTPIYPMFIALVLKTLGGSIVNIILVQTFLSTFNVLLTYFIARKYFSSLIAITASLLLAIGLESITSQFFILTETLFTTLFLGVVYCLIEYTQTLRKNWLISAAILMGLSILCRPIALFFPAIILVLLAFLHTKERRNLLVSCGIFLVVVSAVLTPWYLRSYIIAGKPILSTINSINLLFYNAASLDADITSRSLEQQQEIYNERVQEILEEMNVSGTEYHLSTIYSEMAKKIILEHPVQYLLVHLKYDVRNFLPGMAGALEILAPLDEGGRDGAEILKKEGLNSVLSIYFGDKWANLFILAPFIIILGIVYFADLIGIIVLINQRKWFILGMLLLPIAYYLLIPGAPSNSRFRVPVMPYMSILAGIGIVTMVSRMKRRSSPERSYPTPRL
jgi:4-amino-4-deoxy-L-arabinose transferase-like glycosyltransferase